MNINRHNYEEFFLLYADDELSAADRKAVEVFVAENPDLEAELQLLLQTVMPAEDMRFEYKDILLKEEMTPLQQQLLLYMDDELPAADKTIITRLIDTDAVAAKEAAILLQTKLQPDTSISYAHKKELYRKEEGRLVRMNWRRAVAAAVLLGFATWGGLTLMQPSEPGTTKGNSTATAGIEKNNQVITADAGATKDNIQPAVPAANNTAAIAAVNTNTGNTNTAASQKSNPPAVKNTAQQSKEAAAVNDNNIAVTKEKEQKTNNLPEPTNNPRYNNFNNDNSNLSTKTNVPPLEDAARNVNSGTTLTASNNRPNTSAVNGYAITAAYNPDETEAVNNNKVLYMNEDNVKRSKLAGFIRKVKRVVERNTNIKTGNGIQVAGFDIALNR
ncbi:MAG: hypothetical protein U0V75_14960 [Ferruginibacter sp.]